VKLDQRGIPPKGNNMPIKQVKKIMKNKRRLERYDIDKTEKSLKTNDILNLHTVIIVTESLYFVEQ
jgi:hypothetical protein